MEQLFFMTSHVSSALSTLPNIGQNHQVSSNLTSFWQFLCKEVVKNPSPSLCVMSSKKSLHVSYKITTLLGLSTLVFKLQSSSLSFLEQLLLKMLTENFSDFCLWRLSEGRAEIWENFGLHFGRNDDLIHSFWVQLTFRLIYFQHI